MRNEYNSGERNLGEKDSKEKRKVDLGCKNEGT